MFSNIDDAWKNPQIDWMTNSITEINTPKIKPKDFWNPADEYNSRFNVNQE